MKLTVLLTAFTLLTFYAIAQEKIDADMMAKIREEGMNHSQVPMIAHNITDVAGPRLTGSRAFKKAGLWAVNTLQKWGLVNANMEPWGEFGKGWELEKSYVALKSPYYEPIIAYPLAWSSGTNGLISAPIVVLSKLDSATIIQKAAELKGKIVVIGNATPLRSAFNAYATRYTDSQLNSIGNLYYLNRKMVESFLPSVLNQRKTKEFLMKQGVVAVLTQDAAHRDGTIETEGTEAYKKGEEPGVPQLVLSVEDVQKIERLALDGTVTLELDVKTQFYSDDTKGYNVVAEITGTDPSLKSELVMLGGHMDSWNNGTGATDNGAGCIATMEAVRILKALNVKPRRTIRIALWSGEEQGLYGSYNYVRNHFGDCNTMQLKPEAAKVSAYFNLDNGSGKIRGIFAQNNEQVMPIFKAWLTPFTDLGAATVANKNTGSTDHQAFDVIGIPGFQFIQDPLDYATRTHHTNMDTYDHLQLDDLKQAATIMAAFVYNTAMRDEMLPRKPLPKPEKWIFDGF